MQRRAFLAASLAALAGTAVLGRRFWPQGRQSLLLSARANTTGEHFAVAYTLAGEQLSYPVMASGRMNCYGCQMAKP